MMSKPREGHETAILREKIRIKKIDRKVYIDELEGILSANREKRNALRIGNDCLRFMTQRQENLSVAINGRIFTERPREEKLPMLKCNLQTSIIKNNGRLFRFGKRLLKQSYEKEKRQEVTEEQELELKRAAVEKVATAKDFELRSDYFLHKQAEVEDFHNREVAAKLIYRRLERILDTLKVSNQAYPLRIKDLEQQLQDRKKELEDFQELKAGANRFLEIEERQLKPLKDELKMVEAHFEKLIAVERNELDDRRKNSSLSKYADQRENHTFSFTGSSNIMEAKIKARNKALVNAQDTLTHVMDAMLLTDLKHVVDSIVDQDEVTNMLQKQKEAQQTTNVELRNSLEMMKKNQQFLKYNGTAQTKSKSDMETGDHCLEEARLTHQTLNDRLAAQDKLKSNVKVALHSMFEKLRPVKVADPNNLYKGNILEDAVKYKVKLARMLECIHSRTVSVGHVRPLMLHVFQERRVPPDSIRVVLKDQDRDSGIGGFDAYEADQPGYVSREMLKARSDEAAAPKKKRKRED